MWAWESMKYKQTRRTPLQQTFTFSINSQYRSLVQSPTVTGNFSFRHKVATSKMFVSSLPDFVRIVMNCKTLSRAPSYDMQTQPSAICLLLHGVPILYIVRISALSQSIDSYSMSTKSLSCLILRTWYKCYYCCLKLNESIIKCIISGQIMFSNI